MHLKRILRFQAVALGGTVVNMGVLWFLKGQLHWPVVLAGACAIELAIIHNFTWHYFRTWKDRVSHKGKDFILRLLKYNCVTASIDFIVNLTVLYVLTKYFNVYYLLANGFGMLAGPAVEINYQSRWIVSKNTPLQTCHHFILAFDGDKYYNII